MSTYKEWKREIDAALDDKYGIETQDLSGVDWRKIYKAGLTSASVVKSYSETVDKILNKAIKDLKK